VKVAAPSRVAAFNIDGVTIHHLLKIPVLGRPTETLKPLQPEALRQLQRSLEGVKYIIIDERSFVGTRLFYRIECRLREANPELAHLPFGGFSVILFGDDAQLPPVLDGRLYMPPSSDIPSTSGAYHYTTHFTDVVMLDAVFRQHGGPFLDLLRRIRNAEATEEDSQMLHERLLDRIPAEERRAFEDAPFLFATKALMHQHNHDMLVRQHDHDRPIARIMADHLGVRSAAAVDAESAGGLEARLLICRGARVMLRANLWVKRGLVNGATGTVADILYEEDHRPPAHPFAILVQFDNYDGPSCLAAAERVVPIFPRRCQYFLRKRECTRIQFPLSLAWALTIHK
jgi:ATP-dependent exoDNAse (exonuclease V) alpha subunit